MMYKRKNRYAPIGKGAFLMIKTKRNGKNLDSISAYLQARGSTFAFIMFFLGGLLGGSLFCVGGTDGGEIIRSIVTNELALQLERNFLQLMMSATSGFAGIFIFAYLCINCSKGAILVYLIPLVHGLSVGSFITVILYSYGFSAFAYVAVCIFMPKLVETLLLLSLCNKSSRYCKEQYGGQGTRRKGREVFPTWLYLLLFAIYFAIESLIVFTFRWLL